jgi:hypothetical protein
MPLSSKNTVPLSRPKRFSEVLGLWIGGAIAPVFTAGSALRRRRIFHPRGVYFRAEVEAAQEVGAPFSALAQGLAQGDTLVRLSAGLWNTERGVLPDVLGVALRFNTAADGGYTPQVGSQDLLLVTAETVFTLVPAAFATNQRDFLANVYHGMARFELAGQANMRLRLVPLTQFAGKASNRYDAIRDAVANAEVVFRLEAASESNLTQWIPLVRITLKTEVILDDRTVEFWPFRAAQGMRPQGLFQFMRPVPYLSSQWARSLFK